jgi:hypothetical protein
MRLPYNSSADRNSIMPRLLHPCNEHLGFGKNHWLTFVVAREFLDAVHGIEAKKCDEFDFIAIFANE